MMSVSHRSFARALVLACIGVMPALTWAQSGSAAIAGTVRDSSGRPIAEVSIRLDDPDTGATREMTSGAGGQFEFGGLSPARGSHCRLNSPDFAPRAAHSIR